MFISNHCPYVKHVADELARLGSDYGPQGVAVVAIGSNDVEHYPDDAPAKMVEFAAAHGFTFPYLYDETQEVALAYRAACTPDFFVFDSERTLVYRGQLDGARPSNDVPVDGRDLRAALDAALDGQPVARAAGCRAWAATSSGRPATSPTTSSPDGGHRCAPASVDARSGCARSRSRTCRPTSEPSTRSRWARGRATPGRTRRGHGRALVRGRAQPATATVSTGSRSRPWAATSSWARSGSGARATASMAWSCRSS